MRCTTFKHSCVLDYQEGRLPCNYSCLQILINLSKVQHFSPCPVLTCLSYYEHYMLSIPPSTLIFLIFALSLSLKKIPLLLLSSMKIIFNRSESPWPVYFLSFVHLFKNSQLSEWRFYEIISCTKLDFLLNGIFALVRIPCNLLMSSLRRQKLLSHRIGIWEVWLKECGTRVDRWITYTYKIIKIVNKNWNIKIWSKI